ncbi:MAG TPA: tRNA 2-thiouridine(34) synthase MnmA [Acidobacteriota bacterium]|nr:tRNA 2-thiouridine(34) synthase MnmA [Acidobacteriota bacterium]
MARKKVLVALSGGVDSSVAALLLGEQGYDVVGAHMKLWDYVDVGGDIHRDGRCCTLESITDCRFVCDAIGAPFYVLNMSEHFRKAVIENFVSEYRSGRTPNPCVACNSEVKWTEFLRKAREIGCDYIATGHYSFVEKAGNGRWRIRRGVDFTRDQSYVLWGLSQEALSMTLMPLGGLEKSEVRQIARRHKLRTAERPESREICFVADDDYRRFLVEFEAKQGRRHEPGEIVHTDGRVLGRHNGTAFFTIGQRKGLGIAHPTPLYVQEIDTRANRVIVGDNDTLFRSELTAQRVNWVGREPSSEPFEAAVKIRYLHPAAPATVTPLTDSSVHVTFENTQRAITPGQSVVFYEGDILSGGGIIA